MHRDRYRPFFTPAETRRQVERILLHRIGRRHVISICRFTMRISPTVRQWDPSDAPIIVDLGRETFWGAYGQVMDPDQLARYIEEAFTIDRISGELQEVGSTFFLAELDGLAVGYAKLRSESCPACVSRPNPVELERIYSLPAYIERGKARSRMRV